jgi:hypothetical protein
MEDEGEIAATEREKKAEGRDRRGGKGGGIAQS